MIWSTKLSKSANEQRFLASATFDVIKFDQVPTARLRVGMICIDAWQTTMVTLPGGNCILRQLASERISRHRR